MSSIAIIRAICTTARMPGDITDMTRPCPFLEIVDKSRSPEPSSTTTLQRLAANQPFSPRSVLINTILHRMVIQSVIAAPITWEKTDAAPKTGRDREKTSPLTLHPHQRFPCVMEQADAEAPLTLAGMLLLRTLVFLRCSCGEKKKKSRTGREKF